MSGSLSNAISGLRAAQRSITTASHNIANAGTEGYTRQRVIQSARVAHGRGMVGSGVEVTTIERIHDRFSESQLRISGTELQRVSSFHDLASRLDSTLDDSNSGINTAQSDFFNALRAAVSNPLSPATRQGVLDAGADLSARFNRTEAQLSDINREINQRIEASVAEINRTAADIADLNRRIVLASSGSTRIPPNDLLDQRDSLLSELADQVSITTIEHENNDLTVILGNGIPLITRADSFPLTTITESDGSQRKSVATNGPLGQIKISDKLSGGVLGGLADFQRELLEPTRRELGRIASVIQHAVNTQHSLGVDANGEPGQAFFNPVSIPVASADTNTGTAAVTVEVTDAGALVGSDYHLQYDGAQLLLTRTADGVTLSGNDSLSMDGLAFSVTGDMQPGDEFTIRPFANAASDFSVRLIDPGQLALGIAASASSDEGPSGQGDTRNGSELVGLQSLTLFNRGENTIAEQFATLVTEVGGVTRIAGLQRNTAQSTHDRANSDHDSTSGVNLDEEAVNLVRSQQVYEASARVISVANDMFNTLIATVSR